MGHRQRNADMQEIISLNQVLAWEEKSAVDVSLHWTCTRAGFPMFPRTGLSAFPNPSTSPSSKNQGPEKGCNGGL